MTELVYLKNTYLFEYESSILDFGENEFGKFIILNKTIFYPQGGGQPSDTGIIKLSGKVFVVKKVRLNENGTVFHYGETEELFEIGEKVKLEIDKEDRIFNARNHSAGHLIDVAMNKLGFSDLIPTKGYHFKDGSYVEYEGSFSENSEIFMKNLNLELETLISKDLKVIINYEDLGEIKAPIGKTPRFVNFEGEKGCGCGCGGTHIISSKEIGKINIRKAKYKNNILKISYEIL